MHDEPIDNASLSELDAAALESLAAADFDPAKVPEKLRPRALRLASLLGLLDTPAPLAADEAAALTHVTLARILRDEARREDVRLLPMDEEALDAWVLAGFDARRVPSDLRPRAQRHEAIAGLLQTPAEAGPPAGLAARTLALVERDAAPAPIPIDTHRARVARIRWADFASAAAAILVLAAVVWPMFAAWRQNTLQTVCQANLGKVAWAMSAYAGDHRDSLPVISASLHGGRWWDVGTPSSSNSANLFTLARSGYAKLADLACPGNRDAPRAALPPDADDWRDIREVSYSYQIMFGSYRPLWKQPARTVVMADRSPVILHAIRGEVIYPLENSPNHSGYGQDVLFSDGSAEWIDTPVVANDDNIWLPRAIEDLIRQIQGRARPTLNGTEIPAQNDIFLGP